MEEKNQIFHLSLGNWKMIKKSIDHYFFKNNETNFRIDLEEEKLVKGESMELFNMVIIVFSIMIPKCKDKWDECLKLIGNESYQSILSDLGMTILSQAEFSTDEYITENKKDKGLLQKLDEYEMEVDVLKNEISRLKTLNSEKDHTIEELSDQVFAKSEQLKNEQMRHNEINMLGNSKTQGKDEEVSDLINKYQEELKARELEMDNLHKKNEKLIEENAKQSRKLSRLSGIEERFISMNSEKKGFDDITLKNKELARENKQKSLEIDS